MSDKSIFSMGFSKTQLGCCGYDDLAHKPATTSPIFDAKRFPKARDYKPVTIGGPRFSTVGTISYLRVENLPRPSEGLLQRGRREGRS